MDLSYQLRCGGAIPLVCIRLTCGHCIESAAAGSLTDINEVSFAFAQLHCSFCDKVHAIVWPLLIPQTP